MSCCSEEWLYVCHVAVGSGYTYVMLQWGVAIRMSCCSEEWLYVCHVAVRSGYTYVVLQ